jgi:hypothetical protein
MPTVTRILRHFGACLGAGITATWVLWFLVDVADLFTVDSDLLLLQRLPLAWLLYWPKLILQRGSHLREIDRVFSLTVNVVLFALLFCALRFIRRRLFEPTAGHSESPRSEPP